MKKIAVLLILIFQKSYSQDITLKWAEKIPTRGSVNVLGGKNGLFYTTHTNNDNNLVGRTYDKELSLKNEKIIDFNIEQKKYGYRGAYFLENGIVHFVSESKRKEDKQYLYSILSDFNLKTSEKVNIVDEADDNDKIQGFGVRSISPDSTKILIYHEKVIQRKEPNVLIYKVYDSKITNIINKGEVSLPIKSKNYTTKELRVDNIGNVYVLAEIRKEKSERQKNQSDYYFKLIIFAKNKEVKEFDFDYQENDISYIDIIAGNNNAFFCTGFLNNLKGGRKKNLSDEMFFAVLDCNTLKLGKSKMIKVPGLYPEEVKKNEDFVPYKIRKIYQKSDGSYSIVAEQYRMDVITICGQYGCTTRYIEYYCDIACIQTDSKMEVKSISRIPKYQKNAGNASIISTFKNDNTYIIYEDLTSNLEAQSDKDTKRNSKSLKSTSSKSSLFIVTIKNDGEFKKEEVYSYKESKIKARILTSLEINPGEIMLNADDQIGLLKIGK